MFILQIEHEVLNFEGWKRAFDNDPMDRKKAGVRHYHIFQRADNPQFVVIDLEFENLIEAESMLASLKIFWGSINGKIMMNPHTRILHLVETKDV